MGEGEGAQCSALGRSLGGSGEKQVRTRTQGPPAGLASWSLTSLRPSAPFSFLSWKMGEEFHLPQGSSKDEMSYYLEGD